MSNGSDASRGEGAHDATVDRAVNLSFSASARNVFPLQLGAVHDRYGPTNSCRMGGARALSRCKWCKARVYAA